MDNKYLEQTLESTYIDFKEKKYRGSEIHFMLSEFIDNSIGSWELMNKKNIDKKWHDLCIDILIDVKNDYIEITDNASGMDQSTLEESIKRHPKNSNNVMNKFGVGMKNAAFWFAEDLYIHSCIKDGNHGLKIAVETSSHGPNDIVKWKCEDDFDWTKKGTKIVLKKLHIRPYNQKKFESTVCPIIARKFNYYIISGAKINFDITFKNSVNLIQRIEKNEIKAQKINPQWLDEFLKNIDIYLSKEPHYLLNLKEQTINKAKKGEPLEFAFKLNLDNDIDPIDIIIGVQEQKDLKSNRQERIFKNNYGLGLLQNNRYINIPGTNNVIQLGEYTRSDIKRAFAIMELGNHSKWFDIDDNKTRFVFGEYEQEFEDMVSKIGKDFLPLCEAVQNTIGKFYKTKKKTTIDENKSIENQLNSKTNSEKIHWEKLENETILNYSNDSNPYLYHNSYEIHLINSNDPNCFLFPRTDPTNYRKIFIDFNIDHSIWKPITANKKPEEIQPSIYPIIATVGLNMLLNNIIHDKNSNAKIVENAPDDINDLINQIANTLAKNYEL